MTFVIAEPCVGFCDTSCVEVCPVDCIHGPISVEEIEDIKAAGEDERLDGIQLYIDPFICIDCGACEPECPVEAVFEEHEVPAKWEKFTQLNEDYFT